MQKLKILIILPLFLASCATNHRSYEASGKSLNVKQFGAVGDAKTKDTSAFQQALDAAGKQGGEVIVPAGDYLIGSIVMPSNVTLRFEKDAKLLGSPDKADYPLMRIRWEGRFRQGHRALIHAANAQHIAIVGPGMIVGPENLGSLRDPRGPCVFEPIECRDIRLDGFSVQYRRMWTIHLTFCDKVEITNLNIRSEGGNGDGIDIDSCRDVHVAHCDIDTGDDAIAIKSGRGMEAVRIARPTENVLVEDCTLGSSIFGCLSIGSEMSGGVRNVTARHITFTRGATALYIKGRVGRGGFIENVDCSDLTAVDPKCFLRIDLAKRGKQDEEPVTGLAGVASARNFRFSNIRGKCQTFVDAVYLPPEKPLEGLEISNVNLECSRAIVMTNVRDAKLQDIDLHGFSGPRLAIHDVTGIGLENAEQIAPATMPTPLPATQPSVQIQQGADALQIAIDAKPFTTYHFAPTADDPEWHRPYFYPVLSSDGVELTADRDRETMGQPKREHPWHRSVWVGHGDINGADHWTHKKWQQRHVRFTKVGDDSFVEELAWDGNEPGKPVLNETRTVRFVAYPDGSRGIDVASKFTAASGDAVFKVKPLNVNGVEAGWLAARVSGAIVSSKQGRITSSAGAVGEKQAREMPANWCDYSGPIDGKVYGIALFNDPRNPGHPSPFHVREFGLLTHVGVHDWTLPSGQSQTLRHMLLFHNGDASSARLDERFDEFAGTGIASRK